MKRALKPIALAASVLFTDSAFSNETKNAQQANVGVTIGLTGTNLEISKPLNNYVSVRGEMNINGKVNRKLTLENNRYDITFNPDIKSLFVDIHPFSSAFYLTGGLISQNFNFELKVSGTRTKYKDSKWSDPRHHDRTNFERKSRKNKRDVR